MAPTPRKQLPGLPPPYVSQTDGPVGPGKRRFEDATLLIFKDTTAPISSPIRAYHGAESRSNSPAPSFTSIHSRGLPVTPHRVPLRMGGTLAGSSNAAAGGLAEPASPSTPNTPFSPRAYESYGDSPRSPSPSKVRPIRSLQMAPSMGGEIRAVAPDTHLALDEENDDDNDDMRSLPSINTFVSAAGRSSPEKSLFRKSIASFDTKSRGSFAAETLHDGEDDEKDLSFGVSEKFVSDDEDEGGADLFDIVSDDSSEVNAATRHFGPAPVQRQPRRLLAVRKKVVQLTQGHLVLDCPIPSKLASFLPRRDSKEFTHLRYTAATCDPDDFEKDGYTLRQNIYDRDTEMFITITMYNEDELHFTRTMHGVMKNIAHLCSRQKSRMWGKDGWKKVVVCVVADGRAKVNQRTLDVLTAMGVYQEGIAKNFVNGKEVTAHIFEYTTQISLGPDFNFKGAEKGIVPVQMIFCMKERNARKLNSHRWFFNAFSPLVNPNVCILLDVGTRPGPTSLYHLWKVFDQNSNVGGACGEIQAMKGRAWSALLNPFVAAQNFEYKISNILDKPMESLFGYISVLPGAFSAYRYIALRNDEATGLGPLHSYFKGEKQSGKDTDIFSANMYLAEDRILCWELVAKPGHNWVLKYVRQAVGVTDVPDHASELISQRRRWLNGSFFAAVFSQSHFRQIYKTDHSIGRKIALHVEFAYQFVQLILSFFALANFYLTFYFVCQALTTKEYDPFGHGVGKAIFAILRYTCCLLICAQFVLALGNRPQGSRGMFMISIVLFGVIMLYTLFAGFWLAAQSIIKVEQEGRSLWGNNMFSNMVISLLATSGSYLIGSLMYLDPWHMLSSFPQYMILLPFYICTLQIYAFCNTHDVSWGTKGETQVKQDLGNAVVTKAGEVEVEVPSDQKDVDTLYNETLHSLREARSGNREKPPRAMPGLDDYYRDIRTRLVLVWMICNAILAMILVEVYSGTSGINQYLKIILWICAILALFRLVCSAIYLVTDIVQRSHLRGVKRALKVGQGKLKDTVAR